VADQQHRARKSGDQFLQQVERFHVEIVGRFVEDQQVGGPRKRAGEDQPRFLAAGQFAHRRARLFRTEQEVLHVGDDVLLLAIDDRATGRARRSGNVPAFVGIERVAALVDHCHVEIGAEAQRCPRRARARLSAV
jgi:hypothetical protein